MKSISFITYTADETFDVAVKFSKQLSDYKGTIAISGNLGAGKSIFCKGIIATLSGIDPQKIQSPTFNYLNLYSAGHEICHFDLYRLDNAKDFQNLGFDDYLNEDYLCLIEWPERIFPILPKNSLTIKISTQDDLSRLIEINSGQKP